MESVSRYEISKKAVFTLFVSAGLMFVFEYSKQSFFPQITIWYSHIITIIFVSVLSSALSYYIFISEAYKRLYKKELSIRKIRENELLVLTKQQEETIETKTQVLVAINEELKIAKDEAEEASKIKSVFLQNISHEIRTPLNAIIGFSQLIENDYTDKKNVLAYSSIIVSRSNDLLALVEEILVASRLEVGKMPITIETFRIHSFLDGLKVILENLQVKYNKQSVELIIHCNCTNDTTISTDKNKLQFIFSNLIQNAFKYTYSGKIEIGCNQLYKDECTFYVSDTGIGIDKEKQKLIFEKFTQIDNTGSNEFGGFGLGLSIVKGFIELLGGNIFVTSSKGMGSIFTFTIPNK